MKKAKILELYTNDPKMPVSEIAALAGANKRYAHKVVREIGHRSSAMPVDERLEKMSHCQLQEIVERIEAELEFDLPYEQMKIEVCGDLGIPHLVFKQIFYKEVNVRSRNKWKKRRRSAASSKRGCPNNLAKLY